MGHQDIQQMLRQKLEAWLEFADEDFAKMPALRRAAPEVLQDVVFLLDEAQAVERGRIDWARSEGRAQAREEYNPVLEQAREAARREREQIPAIRREQNYLDHQQQRLHRSMTGIRGMALKLSQRVHELEQRRKADRKAAANEARNAKRRDLQKARELIWQDGTELASKQIQRWPIDALYEVALKYCVTLADALRRPARVQAAGGQRVVREMVKRLGRAVAVMGDRMYKKKVNLAAPPRRRRPRSR